MSLLMGIMDIELQIYFSDILSIYRAHQLTLNRCCGEKSARFISCIMLHRFTLARSLIISRIPLSGLGRYSPDQSLHSTSEPGAAEQHSGLVLEYFTQN